MKEYDIEDSFNPNDLLGIYFRSLNKPILNDEEQDMYLREIRDGDEEARKIFIERNLRLVPPIAKKHLVKGVELHDLIQEGNMGLMKSLDLFDLEKGYRFSTYATWWIKQFIVRYIQEKGHFIRQPVHYLEKMQKINSAKAEFSKKFGKEPSFEEIGAMIGMSAENVEKNIKRELRCISLNAPVSADNSDTDADELQDFMPDRTQSVEDNFIEKDTKEFIKKTLDKALSEKEANVLKMRLGINCKKAMTLEEIGEQFSITRERVRQIEVKALDKLRNNKEMRSLVDYSAEDLKKEKPKVYRKRVRKDI